MFSRRSKQPPASAPPHPEDVGVSEEAATSDPDPVVTVDADETAQREGATSAEATEEHEGKQDEPWWLGPSDELPAGMKDKQWRRTRWAATTSTLRDAWASVVPSSVATDARYSSPIELRFSLEHCRWRIATYRAELEELDRGMAAVQLAAVGRFAEGTRTAAMAERLLRRMAERQAAEAEPPSAAPESYASAGALVAAYETAQSELGRIRNDVGRKRQAEVELESLLASQVGTRPHLEPRFDEADAARSIAQLRAEFGDDLLLRHRQPLAAAVRAGEPIDRLRHLLSTLESQPNLGELLSA